MRKMEHRHYTQIARAHKARISSDRSSRSADLGLEQTDAIAPVCACVRSPPSPIINQLLSSRLASTIGCSSHSTGPMEPVFLGFASPR